MNQVFSALERDFPVILFVTDLEGRLVEASDDLDEVLSSSASQDSQSLLAYLKQNEHSEFSRHLCSRDQAVLRSRVKIEERWHELVSRRARTRAECILFVLTDVHEIVLGELERQRDVELAQAEIALKTRQLERSGRVKSQFLSNMSHELRTPLTAILGLSEAMDIGLYGACNDEQRVALQTINRSGKTLLTLINDILDVTKLEANTVALSLEKLSAAELMRSTMQLHKKSAFDADITFVLRPDARDCVLTSDRKRILQVLSHIVSNSVKFSPASTGVELYFGTRGRDVVFSVSDSGPGIPLDYLERIFDPFSQFDEGLDRQHGGAGLGLSLVKKLIVLLGGWLTISNREGGGTEIEVQLPLLKADDDERLELKEPPLTSRGLIWVVENDVAIRQPLLDSLRSWGFETQGFSSAEELYAAEWRTQISLIVLDGRLPDSSGLKCIEWLRSQVASASIPIILLTTADGDDIRRLGLEAGASAYLERPLELTQLSRCIEALLYETET